MSSRTITARGHPLLTPPKPMEHEWMCLTGADVDMMRDTLAKFRDFNSEGLNPKGLELAYLHQHMDFLGVGEEVLPIDRQFIVRSLNYYKGCSSQLMKASSLSVARKFGIDVEPSEKEVQDMQSHLQFARDEGYGDDISLMIFFMRDLGISVEKMPSDEKAMRIKLNAMRQNQNGYDILSLHSYLRNVGVVEDVTKEDKALIESALDAAREEKDGARIAQMHYDLRLIFPREDDAISRAIPPLKKI